MHTVDVTIESLAYGGDGIARHDGLVYFVPNTLPHEQVRVQVTDQKKTFVRAEVVEFLSTSSERLPPRCPYVGSCGGCV